MTSPQPKFVLTHERVMDAPLANVWRCWAEPALLEQWFCPKPWYVTDARMDMRPGGESYSVMNGPDGERFENIGVFLEVIPMQKIVTTDAFLPGWIPSARPFMVAETLMEGAGEGKTKYVWRALHWTEEAMKEHEAMGFHEGWRMAADQLEAIAKGL